MPQLHKHFNVGCKRMDTLIMTLENRKARIGERLRAHGIAENPITFLPYLEFNPSDFATPYEVGCRIMILYALIYTIEEPSKKQGIMRWLKNEGIWAHVSAAEISYLEADAISQKQINELSWQLEAAYILAWALNLVENRPSSRSQVEDEEMDDFFDHVPALGDSLSDFLNKLSYRDTEEIFEENIFYELTTAYFRDLLFNGNKETTDINRGAAFQRHFALNWLRRSSESKDWDETDTST
jgi:hypothetical protein